MKILLHDSGSFLLLLGGVLVVRTYIMSSRDHEKDLREYFSVKKKGGEPTAKQKYAHDSNIFINTGLCCLVVGIICFVASLLIK